MNDVILQLYTKCIIKSIIKSISRYNIFSINLNLELMKGTFFLKFCFASHTKYCIIGGGTGGLNLSAHLIRSNIHPSEIRIFQPAEMHYYQPGWTMVGANFTEVVSTERPMSKVLPKGVPITKERVTKIQAEKNTITCSNGEEFTYDELIVASGLQHNWNKIKGLKQLLDDPNSNVCSIYDYNYAHKTGKKGQDFKGGNAIFTEPAMPIKCAGAPQKILYLWTDQWQKKKVQVKVQFVKTIGVMFGVPKYSQTLTNVAASYGIKCTFKHPLIEVTKDQATFQNAETKEKVVKKFDFLHVTPPMGPHSFIAESGLGDANGYLDLDKFTLRHNKYKNIWGIGDCTSLPNSKTAAAAFSQTEAVHNNLLAIRSNPDVKELPGKYFGYASCPLFVGRHKLMLAEFKYDGVIDETFYSNQESPRYQFYFMKRFIFPLAYWEFVPRGLWAGRKGIRFS